MVGTGRRTMAAVATVAALLGSCQDAGDAPPVSTGPAPVISTVIPDSGAVGDTIRIIGSNFGSTTSTVTLGGQQAAILLWSDTEIRVTVPAGAVTGSVVVQAGGQSSGGILFTVLGTAQPPSSFATDVYSIFNLTAYGCSGCHSGSGSQGVNDELWFRSTAPATLALLVNVNAARGCNDKVRVLPGNSGESVLYQRLLGTCEDRMPQGGAAISGAHLTAIQTWIDQGANP